MAQMRFVALSLFISGLEWSCAAYVGQPLTVVRSKAARVAVQMDESALAEASSSSSAVPSSGSTGDSNRRPRGDVLVLLNPMYLKRKAPVTVQSDGGRGSGRTTTGRETGGMAMPEMDRDGPSNDDGPRSAPSRKVFNDRDKGKAKPWVDKRGESGGGKGGKDKRGRNCAWDTA